MTVLPPTLKIKVSEIGCAQGLLLGAEFSLLEGATLTRQRELIAGRVLARRMMIEMGLVPSQVIQHSSGAPVWPLGLCGSIAHSARHIAVAIARTCDVQSVGIDIEDGRNLDSAASGIGAADEIERAIAHPFAGNREGAARLLFSGKEALYKCQAPLTGNKGLDFPEVRLELGSGGVFEVHPTGELNALTLAAVSNIKIIFERIQELKVAVAWSRT